MNLLLTLAIDLIVTDLLRFQCADRKPPPPSIVGIHSAVTEGWGTNPQKKLSSCTGKEFIHHVFTASDRYNYQYFFPFYYVLGL